MLAVTVWLVALSYCVGGCRMRFIEQGPDIPDSLLDSVNEGKVVFLCGAGVSKTAGLHLFEGLVKEVYARLGEPFDEAPDEPEERRAFKAGEYDRVLRAFEKRTRSPGSLSSRVRETVTQILQPTGEPLNSHLALLKLSRDIEGRPRLVTTNFDTLFERAWPEPIPSHAGPAMPAPGTPRDHGVLHLHGRIADVQFGLTETDLILTSADFGDAYLRSAWASRYIDERLRLHDLVLVGYQAEDAAMRLLLDAVDADRARFPDIKNVYAFEEKKELADQWKVKGVYPIVYGFDHNNLYQTIELWADYAKQPEAFARKRLSQILRSGPGASSALEKTQATFLVGRHARGNLLAELNPSLAWARSFQEAGLFSSSAETLRVDAWLAQRLDDADAITACIDGTLKVEENLARHLETVITRRSLDIPAPFVKAWQVIIRLARTQPEVFDYFSLSSRLESGDRGRDVQRAIARTLRPRLRLGKPWLRDLDPDQREKQPIKRLADLVKVEIQPNEWPNAERVLAIWPADAFDQEDFSLLQLLTHELTEALHDATEAERITAEHDKTAWNVKSVSQHGQDEHSDGFYPIVRVTADLWERLALKNEALARSLANDWREAKFLLLRRLALHAFCHKIFSGDEAAGLLLEVTDADLWASGARREATKLLTERWNQFSGEARTQLENRLCEGPPLSIFRDAMPEAEVAEQSESKRFVMLTRVVDCGGSLEKRGKSELLRIRSRHPEWRIEDGDLSDFDVWFGETRHETYDRDVSELSDVPEGQLVEKALALEREYPIDHSRMWSSLCRTEPERAYNALQAHADQGQWNSQAWTDWLFREQPISPPFCNETAQLLLRMPQNELENLVRPIASWLAQTRKILAPNNCSYWLLWERMAEVLAGQPATQPDAGSRKDIVTSAINSAPGNLAEIILFALNDLKPEGGSGFPQHLAPRFEFLVTDHTNLGLIARVIFVKNLSYLYEVHPEWVKMHLLPRLCWEHEEAPVMWAARSYDAFFGSTELFDALREPFLDLLLRDDVDREVKRNMTQRLLTAAIHPFRSGEKPLIDLPTVRRVLRQADALVRRTAASRLWRAMDSGDYQERGKNWRDLIAPVFEAIWPLDVDLRDAESSKNLVRLALAAGDAVDAAADTVLPYLVEHQESIETFYFANKEGDRYLTAQHGATVVKLMHAMVGNNINPAYRDLMKKLLYDIASNNNTIYSNRRYTRLVALADQ